MTSAVVVPIKAFRDAKIRLAAVLGEGDRDALARAMAARVLGAAAPLPVIVVCDDDEVADFARSHGADVLWTPGLGLDGAVMAGVGHVAAAGHDEAVVAHADLPLVEGFAELTGAGPHVVTLVPDRHDDGTNVVTVPAAAGFRFAYGPGSFHRHAEVARQSGLTVRVVRDPKLAWDVDVPGDLEIPVELGSLPC